MCVYDLPFIFIFLLSAFGYQLAQSTIGVFLGTSTTGVVNDQLSYFTPFVEDALRKADLLIRSRFVGTVGAGAKAGYDGVRVTFLARLQKRTPVLFTRVIIAHIYEMSIGQ